MPPRLSLHRLLWGVFRQIFARLEGARLEERDGYALSVCPQLPLPQLCGVWVEDDSAAPALEAAVGEIEGLSLPCWVTTREGKTPLAEEETRRLGFSDAETLAGMTLGRGTLLEPAEGRLEIARAESAGEFAAAAAVCAAGFEVPIELLAPFYVPDVARPAGFAVYVGRRSGQPVTTATSWTADGAVGVFNVGTPPEHRGRGYAAEVTARAVRDGLASGAELAWLQSSPRARPMYERLGFETVERHVVHGRPPA